jgi:hypothetical protein
MEVEVVRQKGVDSCRWLGVVCLAFCFLAAVPAVATESTITSSGSGFIVTSDGYILTNEHVVGDSETVTVFVEGTGYPATVVTKSAESDLALLKIAASGLTPVALGNSLQVQLLDDVVALGYPLPQFGRDLTVSEGRITSFRTNVEGREGRDTLQHDAVITHGSSGGPLFNLKGEVIGVNFAGVEGSGMQLAIPINETVPLLRSIPSFSPSHMGTAMQILTPQQVAATYTASVVCIEVATVMNWQELLPNPESVQGFQDAVVGFPVLQDWSGWLTGLGFSVVGSAGLVAPRPDGGGFYCAVVLIAFEDARSAQDALQLMFKQQPPSPADLPRVPQDCIMDLTTPLGSGTTMINGLSVSYSLSCGWFACCTQWSSRELADCSEGTSVYGTMAFGIGSDVVRVAVGWSYSESTLPGLARLGLSPLHKYAYQDGYLIMDGRRLVGAQDVLDRLEELTQLVIITATNRLATQ